MFGDNIEWEEVAVGGDEWDWGWVFQVWIIENGEVLEGDENELQV